MSKLYLIHGWTYNLDKWTALVESLKRAGHEPMLLKVPGLTEASDKVWDIDGYVEWLDHQLAGEQQPIVVGHSNGGRIALAYVQRYPQRLKQLFLIDSAGIAHNEAKAKTKLAILRYLAKLGKPLGHLPLLKKLFYKFIGAQDYYTASPNMRITMQHMLEADQKMDFPAVSVPVTIIWGRDDTITPLSDGQKMHRLIAGSQLHVIDGARHSPMATDTAAVAAIINQGLKGHST